MTTAEESDHQNDTKFSLAETIKPDAQLEVLNSFSVYRYSSPHDLLQLPKAACSFLKQLSDTLLNNFIRFIEKLEPSLTSVCNYPDCRDEAAGLHLPEDKNYPKIVL